MNIIQAEILFSQVEGVRVQPSSQVDSSGNRIFYTCWFPSDLNTLQNGAEKGRLCWADFYLDNTARISGDCDEACDYLDSREFKEAMKGKFQNIISCEDACNAIKKYVDLLKVALEEKETIVKILGKNQGNRKRTAKDLGIAERTLCYRLQKYGIPLE